MSLQMIVSTTLFAILDHAVAAYLREMSSSIQAGQAPLEPVPDLSLEELCHRCQDALAGAAIALVHVVAGEIIRIGQGSPYSGFALCPVSNAG
jgi:hypothetical protein